MAEVGLALTETKKIPVTAALRDVGWLPGLFSACVGGPSILSILQAVFVEHRLIAAFQWIVDGWNGILEVAAVIVEPVLVFLLGLLNAVFGWDLALYPHWRPLASIGFVFPLAWLRATWRDGDYTLLRAPAWMTLGALLGAASAGLVPLESSWRVQGLAAALPISMIYCILTFAIPSVLTQQVPALRGKYRSLRGFLR